MLFLVYIYCYLSVKYPLLQLFFHISSSRYREPDSNEETPFFMFLIIAIILFTTGSLLFMLVSIIKDILQFTIFHIPAFSSKFKYNLHNLRFAYKVVGSHLVVSDMGDRRGQFVFLISYLKRRFPINERMNLSSIPSLYKEYPDIKEPLTWLNKHISDEKKLQFIDYMIDLSMFNNRFSSREMRLIFEAGKVFGIPHSEVKSIMVMRKNIYEKRRARERNHRQKNRSQRTRNVQENQTHNSLKVLGLIKNETNFEVIKKAYRNMAKKHHPDRYHNESKAEREKANERFQEISAAYEYLKDKFE